MKLKIVFLVLKICSLAHFLVLQGSAGEGLSPSPSAFPVVPPDVDITPPPVSPGTLVGNGAPAPVSLPKGTVVAPFVGLPPPSYETPPSFPPPSSTLAPQNVSEELPPSVAPSIASLSPPPPSFPSTISPALPPTSYNGSSSPPLPDHEHKRKAIIASTVSVACFFLAVSLYLLRKWQNKQPVGTGREHDTKAMLNDNSGILKFEELPLYSYETIENATDDFNMKNKLGEGGFGPVYQGKLSNGQPIAVKRLSICSTQGIMEFMNEATVISKLQHRNLVKLLGCCVEKAEQMLVYEYMPNRSLDAFLFS